jgi:hypothetical protein
MVGRNSSNDWKNLKLPASPVPMFGKSGRLESRLQAVWILPAEDGTPSGKKS